MNIYISADIEGVTGVLDWEEADKTKSSFSRYAEQMTQEVRAACEGANEAGAGLIFVKDAHDSGRNLLEENLPENVQLIRGWSEHPFSMMQELGKDFYAVLFIGYHSKAGSDSSPLAHTMTGQLNYVMINGQLASEFLINSYIAGYCGVPVVFISGDDGVCQDARALNPNIKTLAVKRGVGNSLINIHPRLACRKINESVREALSGDVSECHILLPQSFEIEISFKKTHKAYRASFYPGVEKRSPHIVLYRCHDFFDFLRMLLFTC